MSEIAEELLADIDKDTVDFVANFDDTTVEPMVLPTRIPKNLLVNGSMASPVGLATNIPPHNLTEIVDACITLVNNPHATLADLLKHVCRARISRRRAASRTQRHTEAYRTGRGRFHDARQGRHRAPDQRQRRHRGHRDSLPGEQVEPHQAHRGTGEQQSDNQSEVSDVRDESDRDGMRIVIELKRSAEPQIVLNQLFKHTSMQESSA